MITSKTIEVKVNANTLEWYRSRGYEVPSREVQLHMMHKGRRIKNGVESRVAAGTMIHVRPADLMPGSNAIVSASCDTCGIGFSRRWNMFHGTDKILCQPCRNRTGFKGGSHEYWVRKLIDENPEARCDISGETDRRFLVLHHLLPRSVGGRNDSSNYVVLSANYHVAFHKWMGGTGVPCRPEDYARFRDIELGAA